MNSSRYKALLLDIGGVLLTNGWDHDDRAKAAKRFNLDWEDFQGRHQEWFDLNETDKITLDEYLKRVVFWKERDFTPQDFKDFMCAQSHPIPDMLGLMKEIKKDLGIRIAAVSNEGRVLSDFRIKTFNLDAIFDDFFVSGYVGYQKPDPHIYQMALDVVHVTPSEVIYVDDRPNLIEAAAKMGIYGIAHTDYQFTRDQLKKLLY